jgi:hypothetical protein
MSNTKIDEIVKERDADRGFNDLAGLVRPNYSITEHGEALNCLKTMRELSSFAATVLRQIVSQPAAFDDEHLSVIVQMVDGLHAGEGLLIEWIQKQRETGKEASHDPA